MKKFILISLSVLAMTVFGSEPVEPAASAPTEPAASGPKRTRQEMKKEVREKMKAKKEMVHARILEACGPDLQTAGCSGKEGGDMMKCMRTYKEAHPEFKISDACREAHGEKREFKKEKREVKKSLRGHKIHQGVGQPVPTSGTTTPPTQ